MTRTNIWWTTVTALALVCGLAAPDAKALRLDEVAIFFEINDTDGDAGIQLFLDGEGWDVMQVFDPDGNEILNILGEGSVGLQGITELFFESAEPSFDEQPLEELLALFPEGLYKFKGSTTEGESLNGVARLTHALPDAPVLLSPLEGEVVDPDDTVIEWLPVADPPGSRIVGYQVIVESDEGKTRIFSVDVRKTVTRVTVPPEFLDPGSAYKYEILAIAQGGNKTISEREFETEDDDEGE